MGRILEVLVNGIPKARIIPGKDSIRVVGSSVISAGTYLMEYKSFRKMLDNAKEKYNGDVEIKEY